MRYNSNLPQTNISSHFFNKGLLKNPDSITELFMPKTKKAHLIYIRN